MADGFGPPSGHPGPEVLSQFGLTRQGEVSRTAMVMSCACDALRASSFSSKAERGQTNMSVTKSNTYPIKNRRRWVGLVWRSADSSWMNGTHRKRAPAVVSSALHAQASGTSLVLHFTSWKWSSLSNGASRDDRSCSSFAQAGSTLNAFAEGFGRTASSPFQRS